MTLTGAPQFTTPFDPASAVGAPRKRPGWGAWARGAGVVAAVAMSAAAVVITLQRPAVMETSSAEPAARVTAGPVGGPGDVVLCAAIAPLVKEGSREAKAFMALRSTRSNDEVRQLMGPFQEFIAGWAPEVEAVVDAHPGASGYLSRNLYRYVDDRRIYAAMLDPGRGNTTDVATWTDSLVALGAGYEVCGAVGVPLW